jgi:PAS domain S-box-containing protein
MDTLESEDHHHKQVDTLHQQAEKLDLEKKLLSPANLETLTSEETHRIILELHERQLELELQNEALLRAQVKLNAAKERYLDLYNLAPVGYCTISEQGVILEANLTAATLLGVAPEELVNKPITRFIHKEDHGVYSLLSKQLFETSQPQVCEIRTLKNNEPDFWVHLETTVKPDEEGTPVGRVVLSDITNRKRTIRYIELGREILQILNEPGDLQNSIQRILTILKTGTGFDAVGIRLQEGDDFPYLAQKGFAPDFLLTENSLIERTADGGKCRDKNGNIKLECTCGLVISGRSDPTNPLFTPGGSFWTNDSFQLLELPLNEDPRLNPRNRCIHQGYASIALVPIRNKERIVGLLQFNERRHGRFTLETVGLLETIASHIGAALMRKKAEEEKAKLESVNRQLQKSESLGRMAGAIAHHFNNKLHAVMGHLEQAIDGLPPGETSITNLTSAIQAAEKAAEVSKMMLAYLGHVTDQREPLKLAEVCSRNLPLIQATMPKNVVLKTDLQFPGPAINANAQQIQQILTNLVTNAWEAAGDDRGDVLLTIKTVSSADIPTTHRFPINWQPNDNRYACLEVSDNGCGIADKNLEEVFSPFFSTKFTGRGLGLSVVLGLAQAHRGVATAESQPGKGSVFRVFFPMTAEEIVQQPHKEIEAQEIQETGTVLLVDDDNIVLEVTGVALSTLGFTVLSAMDGLEAVEVFRRHKDEIRFVLSDVAMPRMDGWETLLALRQITPDIPVILASGYSEEQVMERALSERPQAFLGKPYGLATLRETIRRTLG